ncbi:hypothetical protein N6H14_13300 [Paenibacillus sp. CC-CFT747]|nr:hypothetical protein N6H14_13300 [Paenibacillus sp. CC-CFT747]
MDMEAAVKFDGYKYRLEAIAGQIMNDTILLTDSQWLDYDRLYTSLNIWIHPVRLALEMARFSRLMDWTKPIGLMGFYSMFSGQEVQLMDMGEARLEEIRARIEDVEKFLEAFLTQYQRKDLPSWELVHPVNREDLFSPQIKARR